MNHCTPFSIVIRVNTCYCFCLIKSAILSATLFASFQPWLISSGAMIQKELIRGHVQSSSSAFHHSHYAVILKNIHIRCEKEYFKCANSGAFPLLRTRNIASIGARDADFIQNAKHTSRGDY